MLPQSSLSVLSSKNISDSQYVVVGQFDATGIAKGVLSRDLGKIAVIRLNIKNNSNVWIILSEVRHFILCYSFSFYEQIIQSVE